jgi:hypothetical protein
MFPLFFHNIIEKVNYELRGIIKISTELNADEEVESLNEW